TAPIHTASKLLPSMFLNTFPLPQQLHLHQTTPQFLQKIKHPTLSPYQHQHFPFQQFVTHLDLPEHTSRNPFFT
ncbi:condensation domain-containing protein, partial [Bacillus pumilus]|uniref:condensation domain-containing protein n=1 Tax=Bacillus pumilus TaxID=1408 RepID=UPI0011A7F0E0